MIRWSIAV